MPTDQLRRYRQRGEPGFVGSLCFTEMASNEGFLTEEQRELLRQASQNNGHSSLSSNSQSSFNSDRHSRVKNSRRHHSGKLVREPYQLVSSTSIVASPFDSYRKSITTIIEEYFTSGDIATASSDLLDLNSRVYNAYFVMKLISMAMDRHDIEKEMAAVLLSSLYSDVISSEQIATGFMKLLESADDLALDIPGAVDILALFVSRAVVDDILPPVFLSHAKSSLPEGSKGAEAVLAAEKLHLSTPHHAELLERRWGGSTHATVETAKSKITVLIDEYIRSGDMQEALRCVRDLALPFYHHEVVKRAMIVAIERNPVAESLVLQLLREAADEGLISSSQMSKGFARVSESLDDLTLDVPSARDIFQSLVRVATKEGWLPLDEALPEKDEQLYKVEVSALICEYFLSGDAFEVAESLKELDMPEFNPIFIKKLITLAMDRKNHEKEMASVLLSALYSEVFSVADVVAGFLKLLESAEDTALDVLNASNELALFIARAVVDEVLAPANLDEMESKLASISSATETVRAARTLVSAPHASERILRCWGAGGGTTGMAVDDAKDKIVKLLEEYGSGGVVSEACQCIRELGMPYFHHEVVKKALVMAMETKNGDRMLDLLDQCSSEGLITVNQMTKGFVRVAEGIDDLALDVPDAHEKFASYVDRARKSGWLVGVSGLGPKPALAEVSGVAVTAVA
ncbi:Programmed cell death protein 4 [Nymphaea thermarum]|nr:Programmed cell death protein 4 [Nymphaea thermarum]